MATENELTIAAVAGPTGTESPGKSPADVQDLSCCCSVYVMEAGDFTKIGVATVPRTRLKGLQANCPLEIHLLGHLRFSTFAKARAIEAELHNAFGEFRRHGEWFHMPPAWALNALSQTVPEASATIAEARQQLNDKAFCPHPVWKRPQDAWGADDDIYEDADL